MDNPQGPDRMLVTGPQSGTAMKTAITGVRTLTDDIRTGRVTIDRETGARLLAALRGQRDEAAGWLTRAQALTSAIPLGTNDVGMAMADKFRRRADSDDTSFVVVLRSYVEALDGAVEAVSFAIKAYQDTDQERADLMQTADS
ncbi:hypothetical protein [Actinokineospora enzanensis]|uniref:hypothetical protein n=1 Tax=Actinokineospora enzanensis TaxID=155975 RepID=UPI00039C80B9|nr:hypothetical protein [Actinokineospora enzanensis]